MYPVENVGNTYYMYNARSNKTTTIGDEQALIAFLALGFDNEKKYFYGDKRLIMRNKYLEHYYCHAHEFDIARAANGVSWQDPDYLWFRGVREKYYYFFDDAGRAVCPMTWESLAYEYYCKHFRNPDMWKDYCKKKAEREQTEWYERAFGRKSRNNTICMPNHRKRMYKNQYRGNVIMHFGLIRKLSFIDEDFEAYSKGKKRFYDTIYDFYNEDRIVEKNWKSQSKRRHQWKG